MTVNYVSQDNESRAQSLPNRSGEYRALKPYKRRLHSLQREADRYVPTWQALNEFMHPWSGRYLFSGKNRDDITACRNILNSVIHDAARTCSSGLHGGLTSPAKPWFELSHPNDELMEDAAVKGWLDATQEIMRSVMAKSNFYSVVPNLYLEAIIYGTAVALIDPDSETCIRLRQCTIGEYVLGLGKDLRVNSMYRKLDMSAAQMREEFGEDNAGYTEAVRNALRDGNLDDPTFTIIHAVQPIGMFDNKTHPIFSYESVYFMEEADDKKDTGILLWRGHRSMPFVAVRWATISDDVYGYSPGMMSMADNRMLQTMERDYLTALELAIKPPTTGPVSLKAEMTKGGPRPGDFIPHSDVGSGPGLRPVYQVNFAFAEAQQKIQLVCEQIQNKFYNNLFLSILFNSKQMTATEVAQRLEEKAMVLGPVLERFESELFDPILNRVFNIAHYEYGIVPEAPEELQDNGEINFEYVGSLSQTVKALGLTNISNSLPLAMELLNIDPEARIKLNIKEFLDYVAKASNWSASMTRTDEECEEIEQAQAQAQQQAMEAQQAQTMVDAAKTASETSLSNGSLLTGMEGGMDVA